MPPDHVAPGLLPVLRMAALIRLGFMLLVLAVMLALHLPGLGLVVIVLAESVLFLAALLWPPVEARLHAWFLPAMLAWALVSSLVVRMLLLAGAVLPGAAAEGQAALLPGTRIEYEIFVNAGFNLAWLAVPVVLATWQYGRRGLYVSMTVVSAGSVAATLLATGDPALRLAMLVDLAGRLAIIGLVAVVVERLVAAQRHEQQALEAANRQLALWATTAEQLAESRERNRLARDLHDTLAHSLTGLSVQLQALGRLLATDPPAAEAQLKAAQATVRDGIGEARRSIQALRATPLADLGLAEALRQRCRTLAERLELVCDCQVEEVGVLEAAVEQAIYRIAEGALANVEQHSLAIHVTLRLARRAGAVELVVADDGAGFAPQEVPAGRFGLAGMRERAATIGATLTIVSAPGQGTCITLLVKE